MTEGQFWLALFAGFLVANMLVTTFIGDGRYGLGCLAVPVVASVAVTVYVLMFEPDLLFLFIFYGTAAVAGALGAEIGQVIRNRLGK